MKEQILSAYDTSRVIYLEYEKKIKELIYALIKGKDIVIHTIESRVKDRESLSKKIDRKQDKYTSLEEITDTVGLRIITYFEDDVDKVADLLKHEFLLDEYNSVDKRNKTNPEVFGYASLHYVLKLKEPRASLPEYNSFKGINFEIQIRSILQHAWAEIEHDIGYKSATEVPVDIRRNFSRIASLLELADIEFIRIKEGIKKYSTDVKEKLRDHNLDINIDKVSLIEFILSSQIVNQIDEVIALEVKCKTKDFNKVSLDRTVGKLKYLGIETIDLLNKLLIDKKELIIKFATHFLEEAFEKRGRPSDLPQGISIFYLCYILVVEPEDLNNINEFLSGNGHKGDSEILAKELLSVYRKIK